MAKDKDIILVSKDVEDIVEKTIYKTLVTVGVDISDPIEVQKDFSFMRSLRKTCQSAVTKVIMTLVVLSLGVVVAAITGLFGK